MRTYRTLWRTIFSVLALVAFIASGASASWLATIVSVGVVAAAGAVAGYAWIEDPPRRRRMVRELTAWFGAGAALMLGLPVLLGPSWLAVPALLGVTCPAGVAWVLGKYRAGRRLGDWEQAARLSGGDLESCWLRTTRQLRAHASEPEAVLALVQERAVLLDEIERRDPAAYDALLVRAGWPQRQDR
ncbi:hypothetical protein [Nocardioides caricicola]|uniref:Uncharacterized protein n=1 Tax=Nocardioides caricicola TaxID=634770 RepID=A0ABW0N543_9ACTN